MLKVIDNIPNQIADKVEQWVTGTKIPWFYFGTTLTREEKGHEEILPQEFPILDSPRLTHYFYPKTKSHEEDIKFVYPLIGWVKNNVMPPNYKPLRVMANLTTQTKNYLINLPHVDSYDDDKISFLYYVNNSDGCTLFYDKGVEVLRTQPIKGTGVMFSSNTVHAGQLPVTNNNRYVINMIFGSK